MHATLPLLKLTDFPAIRRREVETLQVNLGYTCNQACLHCHVNAGPNRKEQMDRATVDLVLTVAEAKRVKSLDLTGGAPELNRHFRHLVREGRQRDLRVMDRCNLTILLEPGQEDTARFLAHHQVEIIASLPCYLADNVDRQRGSGVFDKSIEALRTLNTLGYGRELPLSLVFNPQGATLPPNQHSLQADYRRMLAEHYGIVFTRLYVMANMPIARFGSTLVSKGKLPEYMHLLRGAHQEANLEQVMCRSTVSVDWRGYLHDCDFNQMLGLPLTAPGATVGRMHLRDWLGTELRDNPIAVADHCYGCTAGQGSSCGGALA